MTRILNLIKCDPLVSVIRCIHLCLMQVESIIQEIVGKVEKMRKEVSQVLTCMSDVLMQLLCLKYLKRTHHPNPIW